VEHKDVTLMVVESGNMSDTNMEMTVINWLRMVEGKDHTSAYSGHVSSKAAVQQR
jgi:hypothetical protein